MFGNFLSGSQWRKASHCKRLLEQLQYHVKILNDKKQAVSRLLRHDIAHFIQTNDQSRALLLTKELIMVENSISVYDLLLQFSDFILLRFPSIRKQKFCAELLDDKVNEAVSSLLFASARCVNELQPELLGIRKIFGQRYGQLYVTTALELRHGNFVNLEIKEKMSSVTNSDISEEEVSARLLEEIAKESGSETGLDMLRLEYTSHEISKHVIYVEEVKNSMEDECNVFFFNDIDYNVLRMKIDEEEERKRRLLTKHVHPKLSDYDELVSKFKALRIQHRVNDNIPNILSHTESLSQLKKPTEKPSKTKKPKPATKQNSAFQSRKRSTLRQCRDLSPPYKIST